MAGDTIDLTAATSFSDENKSTDALTSLRCVNKRKRSQPEVIEILSSDSEQEKTNVKGRVGDDDDDDEIEIVDPPPIKKIEPQLLQNDDEEFAVVGQTNVMRLPHLRQYCTECKEFTVDLAPTGTPIQWSKTLKIRAKVLEQNAEYCDFCYCYVCDVPSKECLAWSFRQLFTSSQVNWMSLSLDDLPHCLAAEKTKKMSKHWKEQKRLRKETYFMKDQPNTSKVTAEEAVLGIKRPHKGKVRTSLSQVRKQNLELWNSISHLFGVMHFVETQKVTKPNSPSRQAKHKPTKFLPLSSTKAAILADTVKSSIVAKIEGHSKPETKSKSIKFVTNVEIATTLFQDTEMASKINCNASKVKSSEQSANAAPKITNAATTSKRASSSSKSTSKSNASGTSNSDDLNEESASSTTSTSLPDSTRRKLILATKLGATTVTVSWTEIPSPTQKTFGLYSQVPIPASKLRLMRELRRLK